jgi:hypothetical protein
MTHPERVEDYLEHIADAIERATRYVGNLENLQALSIDQAYCIIYNAFCAHRSESSMRSPYGLVAFCAGRAP